MLPQIKKLLYATDLTKKSSYAFYLAVDLARKYDATIVILHCISSIAPASYDERRLAESNRTLKKIEERSKREDVAEIKKRLQEFCQKVEFQIGLPCVDLVSDVIVREGYAVEEILNTADTQRCDVIVLGGHETGRLTEPFLGSVVRLVIEGTTKPVFIAPPPQKTGIDWVGI